MTDGPAVRVAQGRHGRGVFAARAIDAGETLEICPTLELPDADVAGRLSDYVFSSSDDEEMVVLLLGYGMLYNHSAEPNAEYVQHDDEAVAFVALRPVGPGEELTIDYGGEWWDTRELTPD